MINVTYDVVDAIVPQDCFFCVFLIMCVNICYRSHFFGFEVSSVKKNGGGWWSPETYPILCAYYLICQKIRFLKLFG